MPEEPIRFTYSAAVAEHLATKLADNGRIVSDEIAGRLIDQLRTPLAYGWHTDYLPGKPLTRRQRFMRSFRWRRNDYSSRLHLAWSALRGDHDCY